MPKVDFAANRKEAERTGLITSGDYYKVQEGGNRIRILTNALPHPGSYKGTPNFKWLCYVLDRRDGRILPYFMPHTVYKQLEALQTSDDYSFDDVPMPYDVTVNADGAGTKEVKYSVMPAKKEIPLTVEERNLLDSVKPLQELQVALREKDQKLDKSFDPDELPI